MNYKKYALANKKLIFVFTCVKNGKKYIKKLFDSMLSQTSNNFVHYVYDDGSSDEEDISRLVAEYRRQAEKRLLPFEVIYEKCSINKGLDWSTMHCLKQCSCDYFCWIDCDNFVSPTFFNILEKKILSNPGYTCFRVKTIKVNETGDILDDKTNYFVNKSLHAKYQFKYFFNGFFGYSIFCFNFVSFNRYNKDFYFVSSKETKLYIDTQVFLIGIVTNQSFLYVKKAKSYMTSRKSSISNSVTSNTLKENNIQTLKFLSHFVSIEKLKHLSNYISYVYLREYFIQLVKNGQYGLGRDIYKISLACLKKSNYKKMIFRPIRSILFYVLSFFSFFFKLAPRFRKI